MSDERSEIVPAVTGERIVGVHLKTAGTFNRHITTPGSLLECVRYCFSSTLHYRETMMQSRRSFQMLIAVGSLLAALAVAAGAFGAHRLKSILDPPMLAVFETAARYQMYHALGMIAVGLAGQAFSCSQAVRAGWCFAVGIFLFCGSLYAVSLLGIRWLGAVTPIGGLAFILGWSLLGWSIWREKRAIPD